MARGYSFRMDPVARNKGVSEIKRLLAQYGLLPGHLAIHLNVESIRVFEILHGKRRITADSDLRLCKFFKLPDGHFLNLQSQFDLELTKFEMADKLEKIKTVDEVVR